MIRRLFEIEIENQISNYWLQFHTCQVILKNPHNKYEYQTLIEKNIMLAVSVWSSFTLGNTNF
jgi:hypothetical protein